MNFLSKFAFWRKFSRHFLAGISVMILLAFFQTASTDLFAEDGGDSCSGTHSGRNRTTGECRSFTDMCLPFDWLIDSTCPQNSPPYQSSGNPSCTLNVNPLSGTANSTVFNIYPTNLYTPNGTPRYEWDVNEDNNFNDGYNGQTSISKTFPATTRVTLRLVDNVTSGTCSTTVDVSGLSQQGAPVCEIVPSYKSGAAPLYQDFSAGNSRSATGNSIRYEWDLDRTNGVNYGDSTSSYIPTRRFDYDNTVYLRVTDLGNNISSTCISTIDITNDGSDGNQCTHLPAYETQCSNQQSCQVYITRDAYCNVISRGGLTNCQYISGQCGYNSGGTGGTFQGCRRDDYGPNDWVHRDQWCSCAAQFNDTGSLMRGPAYDGSMGACPQAPGNVTNPSQPANRCDDLARDNQICGQRAYGNCTALCNGTRAYYHCVAPENNMCQGDIYCNSEDNRCGGGAQINCPAGTTSQSTDNNQSTTICVANINDITNTNTTGNNNNTINIGDVMNTITNTNSSYSSATGGGGGSSSVNITW